ncbi:hypothetical protein [Mucilaginibacter ginsenosidivorax]|uniref:Uncharacterized protein n=1 Tax=Mucilaginibacter ginsenosidivorax TaxID=862126 RepID=A0A5B8W3V9_9SPHI|nr:hypothetical protein [Mucilaginibacter ginsenosidivorax]QEC78750.1 hypothetical protein FSB76_23400 [Mucilaginibacter ginsenosidivorax]
MTDKVYTYLFNKMNQVTALIITKYDADETAVNNIYAGYLEQIGETGDAQIFINYIVQLISFLEQKEDYEKCFQLLKLQNKIKEYQKENEND